MMDGFENPLAQKTDAARDEGGESRKQVFQTTLAGTWFPAEEGALVRELEACFSHVPDRSMEPVCGLILPHAGYQWSGPTAAHGVRLLQPGRWDRVIIMGPSHRMRMDNRAACPRRRISPHRSVNCRSISRLSHGSGSTPFSQASRRPTTTSTAYRSRFRCCSMCSGLSSWCRSWSDNWILRPHGKWLPCCGVRLIRGRWWWLAVISRTMAGDLASSPFARMSRRTSNDSIWARSSTSAQGCRGIPGVYGTHGSDHLRPIRDCDPAVDATRRKPVSDCFITTLPDGRAATTPVR